MAAVNNEIKQKVEVAISAQSIIIVNQHSCNLNKSSQQLNQKSQAVQHPINHHHRSEIEICHCVKVTKTAQV